MKRTVQAVPDNWRIVRFTILLRSMNLSCHLHFIRSKHRLCVMLAFLRERALQIFAHYHFDEKHFQRLSKNHRNSRPSSRRVRVFKAFRVPLLFHQRSENTPDFSPAAAPDFSPSPDPVHQRLHAWSNEVIASDSHSSCVPSEGKC